MQADHPAQCQRYGVKTAPSTSSYCYANCARHDAQGRLTLNCGDCSWCSCADDVRFVSDLLDQLEGQYCIDRRRVFATGFSNGGMLVYTLGQELPHRFAALVRYSCNQKAAFLLVNFCLCLFVLSLSWQFIFVHTSRSKTAVSVDNHRRRWQAACTSATHSRPSSRDRRRVASPF